MNTLPAELFAALARLRSYELTEPETLDCPHTETMLCHEESFYASMSTFAAHARTFADQLISLVPAHHLMTGSVLDFRRAVTGASPFAIARSHLTNELAKRWEVADSRELDGTCRPLKLKKNIGNGDTKQSFCELDWLFTEPHIRPCEPLFSTQRDVMEQLEARRSGRDSYIKGGKEKLRLDIRLLVALENHHACLPAVYNTTMDRIEVVWADSPKRISAFRDPATRFYQRYFHILDPVLRFCDLETNSALDANLLNAFKTYQVEARRLVSSATTSRFTGCFILLALAPAIPGNPVSYRNADMSLFGGRLWFADVVPTVLQAAEAICEALAQGRTSLAIWPEIKTADLPADKAAVKEAPKFRFEPETSLFIWRGKEYPVTELQGKCLEVLIKAHTEGRRGVLSATMKRIEGVKGRKVPDVFKTGGLWKTAVFYNRRLKLYHIQE